MTVAYYKGKLLTRYIVEPGSEGFYVIDMIEEEGVYFSNFSEDARAKQDELQSQWSKELMK
jgi:hypothetical protein